MDKKEINVIRQTIQNAEETIRKAKAELSRLEDPEEERTVLGIFDGRFMKGDDGRCYPVPPNYASKSMLVEGDQLKLIMKDGQFTFKNIKPVDRIKKIGRTTITIDGKLIILSDGNEYSVLDSTANFFHLTQGDEVQIILPRNQDAEWAAVECVLRRL